MVDALATSPVRASNLIDERLAALERAFVLQLYRTAESLSRPRDLAALVDIETLLEHELAALVRWLVADATNSYPAAAWSERALLTIRDRLIRSLCDVLYATQAALREEPFVHALAEGIGQGLSHVWILDRLDEQLTFVPRQVRRAVLEWLADVDQLLLPTTAHGKAARDLPQQPGFDTITAEAFTPLPTPQENSLPGGLAGRYHIDRLISRRAQWSVYQAHRADIGLTVAIKVLDHRTPDERNEERAVRFRREAVLLARVSSPHVVRIHDFGHERDDLFLVMEWLPGRTLAKILEAEGPLSLSRALEVCGQVVAGLRAVHHHGIVHRDIKPSNVMISIDDAGQELARLIDFGIGKDLRASRAITSQDMILGSPDYMAPEQVDGATITERTDQYALGVLLFHVLTGEYPFEERAFPALLLAHVNDPPRDLRDAMSERGPTQDALAQIVARCLSKDPAHRFRDMAEIAEALDEVRRFSMDRRSLAFGAMLPTEILPDVALQSLEILVSATMPAPKRPRWLGGALALLLLSIVGGATLTLLVILVGGLMLSLSVASPVLAIGRAMASAIF